MLLHELSITHSRYFIIQIIIKTAVSWNIKQPTIQMWQNMGVDRISFGAGVGKNLKGLMVTYLSLNNSNHAP